MDRKSGEIIPKVVKVEIDKRPPDASPVLHQILSCMQ